MGILNEEVIIAHYESNQSHVDSAAAVERLQLF